MNGQRGCSCADSLGETDNLFYRFAFHVQSHKQGCDLRIGALAGKNLRHDRAGLFPGEGLAMVGDAMEGVENHRIQATGDTRLVSNRTCVAVMFSVVHVCQTCSKPHAPAFGQKLDVQRSSQRLTIG